MKLYHVTTTNRAKSILKQGLIPGGINQDTELDEIEREFAGAQFCADSADCICLSNAEFIDMRYGDVVLVVEVDPVQCVGFNGDVWEAGVEQCDLQDAEEIRFYGSIPADKIKVSRLFTSKRIQEMFS